VANAFFGLNPPPGIADDLGKKAKEGPILGGQVLPWEETFEAHHPPGFLAVKHGDDQKTAAAPPLQVASHFPRG